MQYLLAGSGVRLSYLQDRRALMGIDWPAVFDDLTDAGAPVLRWQWCDLDQLTHVVLAIDQQTGRYAGVLGLTRRRTPDQSWLMIDLALSRPDQGSATLPRAMLAHVLARIVCLDGKPTALAAANAGETALRALFPHIRSAALHPPVDGNVITLSAAAMARRVGKAAALLDLREVTESSLLRDLRGLHGVRRERDKAPGEVIAKPARSAGTTRRPRKATQTGLTG